MKAQLKIVCLIIWDIYLTMLQNLVAKHTLKLKSPKILTEVLKHLETNEGKC